MLKRFTLHRPACVEEAIALRRRHGEDAAVYAGGTELLLAMKMGLAHWPHLVAVRRIPELQGIRQEGGELVIGAAATHRDVERDPLVAAGWPALSRLASRVANVRVRAAGTLAGNLAFAEPHADPPALLVALGAGVRIAGPGGARSMPVELFLRGAYETALGDDEVVTAVHVPAVPPGARVGYRNFRVLERPSIGAAAVVHVREGRHVAPPTLVVGAVDEVPRRIDGAPFDGAPADGATAAALADAARAAVAPTDDLAGSAEYKRHVTGVLVRRLLEAVA